MITRILTPFENFAFKFFDFDGRATRLEYWSVIPLVWLGILLMLPGDAAEVWDYLLRREVPPLNPFHYGSLGLFLITFIPRLSLTVRRLHDAGRSGKWAKLPFSAVSLGLIMSFGFLTSALTSDPSGLGSGMLIAGAVMASVSGGFWEALFNLAAVASTMNWEVVLDRLLGVAAQADPGAALDQAGGLAAHDPFLGFQFLFYTVFFGFGPFIALLLHTYFMLLPSERDGNAYGTSTSQPAQRGSVSGKGQSSAFAGYAYLQKRSAEEELQLQAARKAQVKDLYKTRVLGSTGR